MNIFKSYHPVSNFIYFAFVTVFTMIFLNPICIAISFLCGFLYSIILKGKKAARFNLIYMIPFLIVCAALNPLFNHEGATVLCYLPSQNPLTLESIIFGIAAACMLISMLCWFSCFNNIITTDKFIYLFGRITPALSLVLSMTLSVVPKFTRQFKKVRNTQNILNNEHKKSFIKKIKSGARIISVMITWALENAIETADSMKSRGYGIKGRSSFSIFEFRFRDAIFILYIFLLTVYIILGNINGGISFSYFPKITPLSYSAYTLSIYAAYFLLCTSPLFTEKKRGINTYDATIQNN